MPAGHALGDQAAEGRQADAGVEQLEHVARGRLGRRPRLSSAASLAVGRGLAIAVRSVIRSTIEVAQDPPHVDGDPVADLGGDPLEQGRASTARLPGRSRSKMTERSSPSGSSTRRAGSVEEAGIGLRSGR